MTQISKDLLFTKRPFSLYKYLKKLLELTHNLKLIETAALIVFLHSSKISISLCILVVYFCESHRSNGERTDAIIYT